VRPRLVAAVWFGAWAAGTAALLYGPGAGGRTVETALYIALPGAAAALAAALFGHRVLDPRAVDHGFWAALYGGLVAIGAHVLFAPMFAIGFSLTDSAEATVNLPGFALAAMIFGLQTAVVTIPSGAIGGYALYRIRGVTRLASPDPTDKPGGTP
jgi:hypothetical protein